LYINNNQKEVKVVKLCYN